MRSVGPDTFCKICSDSVCNATVTSYTIIIDLIKISAKCDIIRKNIYKFKRGKMYGN